MVANIAAQITSIAVYSGSYSIHISVIIGTAVGLWLKYVLDKRYIFRFKSDGLVHDGQVFALYTTMGILTTLFFWFVEFAFDAFFGSDQMRYLGGAIGLAIGYFAKYHLDKRYVFVNAIADRAV